MEGVEGMADVATRVVTMVTQGILTIAVVWSHFSGWPVFFRIFPVFL